jgi:hypothetical protein
MKMKYEDMGDRPFLFVPVIDERSKDVPLDALTTLVYGLLLYRLGHQDPEKHSMTRTAVSRLLRLDKKAVDRAVAVLVGGGAVSEQGTRIMAIQPQGASATWFRFQSKQSDGEWRDGFIYDRVYLPRSSTVMSVKTNALFWHLVKLGHSVDRMPGYLKVGGHSEDHMKYLSAEYLATGLRCYRRTVARGLTRLRQLGLITMQRTGRNSFVVGIPPIGTNADLWRDSWTRTRRTEGATAEVTAESLFGVPSREKLTPSVTYDSDASLYMRAFGIRGKVAEEIVRKIVKYQIPRGDWQPLLLEAKRDHDNNCEKDPGKFKVKHCGCLFKNMLEGYLEERDARRRISGGREPWGYSEMEASGLLPGMRLTDEANKLLRYAVRNESLELRGGGSVPCFLNWDGVLAVLQRADKDFVAFKKGIVDLIFSRTAESPACDWYDQWMGIEQIPAQDDSPMVALKLDHRAEGLIRTHATRLARCVHGEDEAVAHKHLVNNLIMLGCWQTSSKATYDLEASINDIVRVLSQPRRVTVERLTEAEELSLIC